MNVLSTSAVLLCALLATNALPARLRNADDDAEVLGDFPMFDGVVVDVNEPRPAFPFDFPIAVPRLPSFFRPLPDIFKKNQPPLNLYPAFTEILASFEDHIRQLEQRLNDLNRVSENGGTPFDNLPDNYDNSTTTTQVVDGNVVTINETIHKSKGPGGQTSFITVKVINVRPEATKTEPEESHEESADSGESEDFPGVEELPQNEITEVVAADRGPTTLPEANEEDNEILVNTRPDV